MRPPNASSNQKKEKGLIISQENPNFTFKNLLHPIVRSPEPGADNDTMTSMNNLSRKDLFAERKDSMLVNFPPGPQHEKNLIIS